MSEFNNTTVGGPSCSYASLSNYNNGSQGMSPPVPATTVRGQYIVPDNTAIGYNALTSTVPTCSGYRSIQSAYGSDASGGCGTKYVTKLCGGGL